MSNENNKHLSTMREIHQTRLRILERQLAYYGDISAPPHIIIEIDELRRRIAELDVQLGDQANSYSIQIGQGKEAFGTNTHADLLWVLKKDLIEELTKLPLASTQTGRTRLLDGIPGIHTMSRDSTIVRLDLDLMISQLAERRRMENGELPLIRLIDNALAYVKGTELGEKLEDIQKKMRLIE